MSPSKKNCKIAAKRASFPEKHHSFVESLEEGNMQFIAPSADNKNKSYIERVRFFAANGQNPKAVLVTCSDARISPALIFSAEMGDFFIIRTAGNVVGELELGSIEYAVSKVGTETIIVMGHENCGAIASAAGKVEGELGHIKSILDFIQPSIEKAREESDEPHEIIEKAEDYNIKHSIEVIKSSKIIQKYMEEKKITIVGAKYGIATGKVTFFDFHH